MWAYLLALSLIIEGSVSNQPPTPEDSLVPDEANVIDVNGQRHSWIHLLGDYPS